MAYGKCLLTGKSGKLVKSHLLPKAVTRTPEGGESRLDGYDGGRPTQRFDSWYDRSICTRDGEDILAKYDDWAITELRRLKLIWSGWKDSVSLPATDIEWSGNDAFGLRTLRSNNAERLRLFFLSLLWRAAVTSLRGYRIVIDANSVELLRKMLVMGNVEPMDQFPVVLTQLTTRGPWHNAGPRMLDLVPDQPSEETSFVRFYFEGLIAHVYCDATGTLASKLGSLAVGQNNDFVVYARPFENSAQADWLRDVIAMNLRDHSDTVTRIFGKQAE